MRTWGVATVLLLACCTAAGAQDNSGSKDADKGGGSWWTRLFSFGSKSEPAKAAEADKKKPDAPTAAVESATARQARALRDLNRRNEVCLKLRTIAVRTNDQELLRRVEELEQRVFDIYLAQTAGTMPPDGGEDEQRLERNLSAARSPDRRGSDQVHSVASGNGSTEEGQR
jgi:hypothetical protein